MQHQFLRVEFRGDNDAHRIRISNIGNESFVHAPSDDDHPPADHLSRGNDRYFYRLPLSFPLFSR